MGKRLEQALDKRQPNDQQTYEKVLNLIGNKGKANKNHNAYLSTDE